MASKDIGVGIVWLQLESLVQVGDGVLILIKKKLGNAPEKGGGGEVRPQLECLVIVGDGVLVLTTIALGIAPADVVVGIDLTEVGAGIVRPYIRGEHETHHGNRQEPTPILERAHHVRCPVSLPCGQRLSAMCPRNCSHPIVGRLREVSYTY